MFLGLILAGCAGDRLDLDGTVFRGRASGLGTDQSMSVSLEARGVERFELDIEVPGALVEGSDVSELSELPAPYLAALAGEWDVAHVIDDANETIERHATRDPAFPVLIDIALRCTVDGVPVAFDARFDVFDTSPRSR